MNISTIRSLVLPAAVAALAISCISSTSASDEQTSQFTSVVQPNVPAHVVLCGNKISLDRTDMWERYDRELTSMMYTHGNTLLTIKRANKMFPEMAPILQEQGVPADLLYLACIESNLNNRAYSSAKAAGVWQFIESTAKQYGLEVNAEVDERYNLEKATRAACKMLKSSYKKYGNWESAMAAYNGGGTRISNELAAQMQDSSFDLYLTDETSRYVFRVMAMKEIMENAPNYGFIITADQLYQPAEYKTVEVKGAVEDWPEWASSHGISYAQLREANPWIRAKKLTNKQGKTYQVKIPLKDSLSRKKQNKSVYDKRWITK